MSTPPGPPGGSYPGPDPDDPFAKPPTEATPGDTPPPPPPPPPPAPTEETAPIQREELGYWEKQAQAGQQSGQVPPAPAGYQQNPTTAQFPTDPTQPPPPETANPWAGYGQPSSPQQPAYGAPATPYGTPPYYAAGAPTFQAPHPQATTAMVLGLIGLIGGCLCGIPALLAPFAWVMGSRVKREIRESNGQLGGEGNAQAGFVMGIIGTVVLVVVILALVLVVILAITTDGSSSTGSTNF